MIPIAGKGLSPRGRGKPTLCQPAGRRGRSIPAWAGETGSCPSVWSWGTVYPRVGGGNPSVEQANAQWEGLSPRGRGKPLRRAGQRPVGGSIPAWAGETISRIHKTGVHMVYPRVGGGNRICRWWSPRRTGLSPRGRGKPLRRRPAALIGRSIPAWAGETVSQRAMLCITKVYPRVGGGNHRGNVAETAHEGLSPRGRGKLLSPLRQDSRTGSIPAWAGETEAITAEDCPQRVYPRVGGGNLLLVGLFFLSGLSPRGRGKLYRAGVGVGKRRSIPAWAGETGTRGGIVGNARVYPRVGGGNGQDLGHYLTSRGLSPRGRGKRLGGHIERLGQGSIPAWAGETVLISGKQRFILVYPRVGGGNLAEILVSELDQGLSPRGRGKQRDIGGVGIPGRSIPAWAGEPVSNWLDCYERTVYPRVGGGTFRPGPAGRC